MTVIYNSASVAVVVSDTHKLISVCSLLYAWHTPLPAVGAAQHVSHAAQLLLGTLDHLQHLVLLINIFLCVQGCDGAVVHDLSMLGQQAVAFANCLMSLDPAARPSAQASVVHQLLSPEMMTKADMWHCLLPPGGHPTSSVKG